MKTIQFELLDTDTITVEDIKCYRMVYDDGKLGGYISSKDIIIGDKTFLDKDSVVAGDITLNNVRLYKSQIVSINKQNVKVCSSKESYITSTNIFVDKKGVLNIDTRDLSLDECKIFIGNDACLEMKGNVDVYGLELSMKNDYIYISDTEISESSLEGSVVLEGSEIESADIKGLPNNYKGNKNMHNIINIQKSKIKGESIKCDISGGEIYIDGCNIKGDNIIIGNLSFVDCNMNYINNIQSDTKTHGAFKSCKFEHTFIDVRDNELVENKDLTRVGYGI